MDNHDRVPSLNPLPQPSAQALALLAGLPPGWLLPLGPTQGGSHGLAVMRHLVDGEHVYLRVRLPDGRLSVYPARLTYQAQRIDAEEHTGWLVLVAGLVRRVTEPDEQARFRVSMRAWPDEDTEHLLHLHPEQVTTYHLTRERA